MSRRRHIIWWQFQAWDALFFKDALPWGAPGGVGHESLFPPNARTVAGAVRRAIGEQGSGTPAGRDALAQQFRLLGPFVCREHEAVFRSPAPLLLGEQSNLFLKAYDSALGRHQPLLRPALSDLGNTVLAGSADEDIERVEEIEDGWLTKEGLSAFLGRAIPEQTQLLRTEDLVAEEPRVSITLQRGSRAAAPGLFAATTQVRPRRGVSLMCGLVFDGQAAAAGLMRLLPKEGHVRLGAEGHMVYFRQRDEPPALPAAPAEARVRRFLLYFATPALFAKGVDRSGAPLSPPDGDWRTWYKVKEHKDTQGGRLSWVCRPFSKEPGDVAFRIVSASLHRPVPLGGFRRPAPARNTHEKHLPMGALPISSGMAAGAVWFCETLDGAQIPHGLHGAHLGTGRELGYGHVLLGSGWGP